MKKVVILFALLVFVNTATEVPKRAATGEEEEDENPKCPPQEEDPVCNVPEAEKICRNTVTGEKDECIVDNTQKLSSLDDCGDLYKCCWIKYGSMTKCSLYTIDDATVIGKNLTNEKENIEICCAASHRKISFIILLFCIFFLVFC